MLTRPQFAAACALAFIAACATGHNGVKADEPAKLSAKAQATLDRFELTGDTRRCLSLRRVRSIRPLSDDLFLVHADANKYYLNRPATSCTGAADQNTSLAYNIPGLPSLCKGEVVTVNVNTSGPTLGGCAMGEFEELSEKDAG